jgi:hypothetical protein
MATYHNIVGDMLPPMNVLTNAQALTELRHLNDALHRMQPSTILNSLQLARNAVAVALLDMQKIVELTK